METYTVQVECTNCGRTGQINVPKGTLVPKVAVCLICGCETAHPENRVKTAKWPSSYPRQPIDWGNAFGVWV